LSLSITASWVSHSISTTSSAIIDQARFLWSPSQ